MMAVAKQYIKLLLLLVAAKSTWFSPLKYFIYIDMINIFILTYFY